MNNHHNYCLKTKLLVWRPYVFAIYTAAKKDNLYNAFETLDWWQS